MKVFHSVTLDVDKCTGCTNCLKRCPTEAIRVRDGKARIIKERCIDCGECIRVCPHHAKVAVTDSLDMLSNYKYKIAMPAPTLYGQFDGLTDIGLLFNALKKIGFDDVFETTVGADVLSFYIRRLLKADKQRRPFISSACPAIVRLIQVRFPALRRNVVNLRPPVEVAAILAREKFAREYNCAPEDIGIFFISPCPAKMTAKISPPGNDASGIDGVVSVMDLYGPLSKLLQKPAELGEPAPHCGLAGGMGWAASGGEAKQVGIENYLAVDGIYNVIRALEEIENGKLRDIDFFEGLACTGGCVGGPLVFENSYIARMRINRLTDSMAKKDRLFGTTADIPERDFGFAYELPPNTIMKLSTDFRQAAKMLEEIDIIEAELPGLDCGSCGSPSCHCFAEDLVRGYAKDLDCIFKLREQYKNLVENEKRSLNDNSTKKG